MIRKIIKPNEGVVGIVVAVLLIGLMISVVSLVQVVYVPKWMEQKEAEHMDEVFSQFSQLKFAIDTQAATKQLNTPIATSITLGSKEMEYLMSVRAFGHLEILSGSFEVSISNATYTTPVNHEFGTIKYSSANAYFIDQSFIYEGGAIVVSQADGNMISIKPSFSIEVGGSGGNEDIICINIANITGIGGKNSSSGYGTTAIQTEYVEGDGDTQINYTAAESISFTTSYANAWCIFLTWLFEKEFPPATYTYTISTVGDNLINIEFFDFSPEIKLKIVDINAQIGAGWIE